MRLRPATPRHAAAPSHRRPRLGPLPALAPAALVAIGLAAALGAVACAAPVASPTPTATPPPPTAVPTPAGATPEATPAGEPVAPGPAAYVDAPTACVGLEAAPCAEVKEAVGALVPTGAEVVYVEIGPFGCAAPAPDETACPPTLEARTSGFATVEIVGAEPILVAVTAGAEGIEATREQPFTVSLPPTSAKAAVGRVPYELGHCGLGSGIDLDGSWWDPVGFVDYDHPDAINAARSIVTSTGPDSATLETVGGLVVQLVRRTGPKALPLCS